MGCSSSTKESFPNAPKDVSVIAGHIATMAEYLYRRDNSQGGTFVYYFDPSINMALVQ